MQIVCVTVSDQIFNLIMPILCLDVRKFTHFSKNECSCFMSHKNLLTCILV